jgi:hypothetical protein
MAGGVTIFSNVLFFAIMEKCVSNINVFHVLGFLFPDILHTKPQRMFFPTISEINNYEFSGQFWLITFFTG